jgi:hypothetical protein
MHEGAAGVAGVVKPNVADAGRGEDAGPPRGESMRADGFADLVDDHVSAEG